MGRHDKQMFDLAPIEKPLAEQKSEVIIKQENWPESRIYNLQNQLENAQRKVAMQEIQITTLEKALAETTDKLARTERAFIEEAVKHV